VSGNGRPFIVVKANTPGKPRGDGLFGAVWLSPQAAIPKKIAATNRRDCRR
jgi:hypothetical protein